MIRESFYTSLGAAALVADFVTSPERQSTWLKKAERRGSKVAQSTRKTLRPLVQDLRSNALSALRLGEEKAEETGTAARRTVRRARRATPRVSVTSRRTRGTTGTRKARTTRRVRKTTVSVTAPVSQAS